MWESKIALMIAVVINWGFGKGVTQLKKKKKTKENANLY